MNASRPLSGNGCKQTGHPASGRFCLFQCAVIKYDCKRQQELERPRTEPSLLTAVVDTFAEEEDWSSARPAIKLIQQSTRAYAKYGQHDDYAEKGGEISHACEYARLQEGRGARSRESRHTTPVKLLVSKCETSDILGSVRRANKLGCLEQAYCSDTYTACVCDLGGSALTVGKRQTSSSIGDSASG